MGVRSSSCSSFLSQLAATYLKVGTFVVGIVNTPKVLSTVYSICVKCLAASVLAAKPFEFGHEEKLCKGKRNT